MTCTYVELEGLREEETGSVTVVVDCVVAVVVVTKGVVWVFRIVELFSVFGFLVVVVDCMVVLVVVVACVVAVDECVEGGVISSFWGLF